jgi:hypothetical protein
MPESLIAVLRKHHAAQAEERLFLGNAYKNSDLVFAHADGSPVDPWNFGSAVRDCIQRAFPDGSRGRDERGPGGANDEDGFNGEMPAVR